MKRTILALAVAGALMLAGCGGGGSKSVSMTPTPAPTVRLSPLPVPGGPAVPRGPETPAVVVEIPDNTVRINPGQTRNMRVGERSVSIQCPSGGVPCHVGVNDGSLWYRLDGAVPFARVNLLSPTPPPTPPPPEPEPTPDSYTAISLPSGHDLESGTMPAGTGWVVHETSDTVTAVTCPAGGEDCVVSVTENGAESIGGVLTVRTISITTVELPRGHTLMTGNIPAGTSLTVHEANGIRTVVTCPAGGEDCFVTLMEYGAEVIGGVLTVESTSVGLGTVALRSIPMPTTWEQLPTTVDSMDYRAAYETTGYPWPSCSTLAGCQSVVKSLLATATEPTGTRRRFQGTRTVRTSGGDTATETYYGGWLDNSVFVASGITSHSPIDGRTVWRQMLSMGIADTAPVTGVYRGEAVSTTGTAGTSKLNYTSNATGGKLDLTITMRDLDMVWSNIPVDGGGKFHDESADAAIGPQRLRGAFYQGGEVGGRFIYRVTSSASTYGAFGAELTP